MEGRGLSTGEPVPAAPASAAVSPGCLSLENAPRNGAVCSLHAASFSHVALHKPRKTWQVGLSIIFFLVYGFCMRTSPEEEVRNVCEAGKLLVQWLGVRREKPVSGEEPSLCCCWLHLLLSMGTSRKPAWGGAAEHFSWLCAQPLRGQS